MSHIVTVHRFRVHRFKVHRLGTSLLVDPAHRRSEAYLISPDLRRHGRGRYWVHEPLPSRALHKIIWTCPLWRGFPSEVAKYKSRSVLYTLKLHTGAESRHGRIWFGWQKWTVWISHEPWTAEPWAQKRLAHCGWMHFGRRGGQDLLMDGRGADTVFFQFAI